MSDFSLPTSLNQKLSPLIPQTQQKQLVQMIAWMLQHRLLLQLHTYVHLMPSSVGHPVECVKKASARSTPKNNRSRTQSGSDFDDGSSKIFKLKSDAPNFKSVNINILSAFFFFFENRKLTKTFLIINLRFKLYD